MRNVAFAGGKYEAEICDLLPSNEGRSSMVYRLINAYGLVEKCTQITVVDASKNDLMKFHDAEFVKLLLRKRKRLDETGGGITWSDGIRRSIESENEEDSEDYHEIPEELEDNALLERFGLLYDCPVFPYMDQYIRTVSGSSLSAARFLCQSDNKIAINWNGGRHHCKKSKASGFCYVNDIVLSILELRRKFDKVLYIDFDLHHGDGIESAFKFSDKVTTFSVHRKDIGFFPGTGELLDTGKGKGLNHCFNIPTKHGLNDLSMGRIVNEILIPVVKSIQPDCLVIQCGCDGLNSDEHQEWNLTIKEFGKQIGSMLDLDTPTLLLGGGGYNHQQAARFWTYVTSLALDLQMEFDILPDVITEEDEDNYDFWNVKPKNMIDENDDVYIDHLKSAILNRLN